MKSVFEDVAPQLSLQYATKFFVDFDLPKDEQSSNWCERPLKEEKMMYAAQVRSAGLSTDNSCKCFLGCILYSQMLSRIAKTIRVNLLFLNEVTLNRVQF